MTAMSRRGFTLIELLIAVSLVAVILALVGPSFRDFILLQRLKGSAAELVTDLQYARGEAVSRSRPVFVTFGIPTGTQPVSCYTIYTDTRAPRWELVSGGFAKCNCTAPAGSRCTDPETTELRTHVVPASADVKLSVGTGPNMAFDPVSGGIISWVPGLINPTQSAYTVTTSIGSTRSISTVVSPSGRPQNCLPAGSVVTGGYPAC